SNLWANRWETEVRVPYRNTEMLAATWEPAFDSSNRMVVGYNSYVAGRFVGVYDDPLGPDTLPDSYLYDFSSMPYTATFDDEDNLYVGDINRGRVLVYHNPFDNPPRQESATTTEAVPPSPRYTATIYSVDPKPPHCVIPSSSTFSETTLNLGVERISEIRDRDFAIRFRRVTGGHREWFYPNSDVVRMDETSITIDLNGVNTDHWRSRGKAILTLQITDYDEAPLTNWSPTFILAEDKESCETESPISGPTPSDVQSGGFVPYTSRPSLLDDYLERFAAPETR
ncbi:MAG: hypothetical protein OXC95_02690, partial [Dehalococcoidia bacterium]|nr:hypothetical protein [Dehalococcoidia bacterium]